MLAKFKITTENDNIIYDDLDLPTDYLFYPKGYLNKKDFKLFKKYEKIKSAKFIYWLLNS